MDAITDLLPEPYGAWLWAVVLLAGAALAALIAHTVIYFVADRIARKTSNVADSSVVQHTPGARWS